MGSIKKSLKLEKAFLIFSLFVSLFFMAFLHDRISYELRLILNGEVNLVTMEEFRRDHADVSVVTTDYFVVDSIDDTKVNLTAVGSVTSSAKSVLIDSIYHNDLESLEIGSLVTGISLEYPRGVKESLVLGDIDVNDAESVVYDYFLAEENNSRLAKGSVNFNSTLNLIMLAIMWLLLFTFVFRVAKLLIKLLGGGSNTELKDVDGVEIDGVVEDIEND